LWSFRSWKPNRALKAYATRGNKPAILEKRAPKIMVSAVYQFGRCHPGGYRAAGNIWKGYNMNIKEKISYLKGLLEAIYDTALSGKEENKILMAIMVCAGRDRKRGR
jgi:hypothetical protein